MLLFIQFASNINKKFIEIHRVAKFPIKNFTSFQDLYNVNLNLGLRVFLHVHELEIKRAHD